MELMQNVLDRLDGMQEAAARNHVETVERLTRLETSLKGLPDRVGKLERRRWILKGALAVLTFLVTSALALLGLKH